jgi:O-antigen ligase
MLSINMRENLGLAFWAALFYVFVEYMRLQEKYSIFYGIPFGKISATIFFLLFVLERKTFSYANRINRLIIVFSIWMIITGLLGINLTKTISEVIDIFKFFLIYFLTINVIENKRQLYFYVTTILIIYFLHTNFSFRQWVAQDFYAGIHGIFVGSGFFNNPNDYGAALCAFWGISLYMIFADKSKIFNLIKMRWFHIVNTLLLILAILLTSSRGALLALLGSAIYSINYTKRKILGLLMLVICGMLCINLLSTDQLERFRKMGTKEDSTARERIETWKDAIQIFKDFPVTGVGIGNFVEANQTIYESDNPYVQHNIYLEALTETGLPGLLIFLLIIYSFFKNQKEVKFKLIEHNIVDPFFHNLIKGLNISMVGFLIAGFFITVLFYPFLWVNLTISVALKKVVENEIKKGPNLF